VAGAEAVVEDDAVEVDAGVDGAAPSASATRRRPAPPGGAPRRRS
jgi:hypothetical protein